METPISVLKQAIVRAEKDSIEYDRMYHESVIKEQNAGKLVNHYRVLAEEAEEGVQRLYDALSLLEKGSEADERSVDRMRKSALAWGNLSASPKSYIDKVTSQWDIGDWDAVCRSDGSRLYITDTMVKAYGSKYGKGEE